MTIHFRKHSYTKFILKASGHLPHNCSYNWYKMKIHFYFYHLSVQITRLHFFTFLSAICISFLEWVSSFSQYLLVTIFTSCSSSEISESSLGLFFTSVISLYKTSTTLLTSSADLRTTSNFSVHESFSLFAKILVCFHLAVFYQFHRSHIHFYLLLHYFPNFLLFIDISKKLLFSCLFRRTGSYSEVQNLICCWVFLLSLPILQTVVCVHQAAEGFSGCWLVTEIP